MARYIDAEKCPCKGCGVMYCYKNCKEYDEWFNGCDYDVEAKVAELEKQANDNDRAADRLSGIESKKKIASWRARAEVLRDAAEIVRGKE